MGVGFHIYSTDLPKGTFILCIIIIDGCWFLSKPWRLCINSEYGQLPFVCQVWSRLCVMHHKLCYTILQKFYSIMNDLHFLIYDDKAMLNIKSNYYNSFDVKGSYCVKYMSILAEKYAS